MARHCVPGKRVRTSAPRVTPLFLFHLKLRIEAMDYSLVWSGRQLVSCNNGPPSRTESVMHAEMVGAAANQLHHFPPNEFYDPPTVCAVMAGLLVRDVCDPTALANPAVTLVHPLQLMADTAWHGGAWAAAFTLDSSGPPAYVIHLLKKYKLPLVAVASISLLYGAILVAGLG
jgi:hypothetical protein